MRWRSLTVRRDELPLLVFATCAFVFCVGCGVTNRHPFDVVCYACAAVIGAGIASLVTIR